MAKAKRETKMSSKLRIETCPDCDGKPVTIPFLLENTTGSNFKGSRCEKCYEVVSYEKIK